MKLLLAILICWASQSQAMTRAQFMSQSDAEKKWGAKPFSVDLFRAATPKTRSAMAADLAKRNPLKGKSIQDVRGLLGRPDGYFFSDRILAYQIEPFRKETGESWQVIFVPKDGSEEIEAVRIHKKCCYKAD